MKNNNKIYWINGLKGVAAVVVLIHHFALFFYPAFIEPAISNIKTSGNLELKIARTPLNIFGWGGNSAVCIFFLLSGFLIAFNFFKSPNKIDNVKKIVKRYLKLVIPILISSIIIFFIVKSRIFRTDHLIEVYKNLGLRNNYAEYNQTIFEVICDSIIGLFKTGSFPINPPMWTMRVELIYSVATMIYLSAIGKSDKRYIIYFFTILFMINSYFLCFILGVILCDLWYNKNEIFDKLNRFDIKLIILIIGLFFISTTYINQSEILYSIINNLFKGIDYMVFYHSFGAFFIVLFLMISKKSQKIFSMKLFNWLGDLSLSIYLFHWVIINTVSMFTVSFLIKYLKYYQACIISFIITFIVVILISKYFDKYIKKITKKSTDMITNKIFDSRQLKVK